jgi:hypothetical protein
VSYCVTATCPHGRGVFIWLGDGQDPDGRYPWVHNTTLPGSRGHLEVCELMEAATAAEGGETCGSCGHAVGEDGHPWPKGRHTGDVPSPLPCTCGCTAWSDPPPPERALAADPSPNSTATCSRQGCGHRWIGHKAGFRKGPCQDCRCPAFTADAAAVMPPEPPRQLDLFSDLEAIA